MLKIKLSLLLLFQMAALAGQNPAPPLEIRVVFTEIPGKIDPWRFQIFIRNISGFPVYILPLHHDGATLHYGQIQLEKRSPGDTTWVRAQYPKSRFRELAAGPSFLDVQAFEEISSDTFVIPSPIVRDRCRNCHFDVRIQYSSPILMESQAAYREPIFSAPITITVKSYAKHDQKAYKYLSTLAQPDFLYRPAFISVYGFEFQAFENESAHIIKHFPNSNFASWAHLYSFHCFYERAIKFPSAEIANRVEDLRIAKKYAELASTSSVPEVRRLALDYIQRGYFFMALNRIYFSNTGTEIEMPEELFLEFSLNK